MPRRLVLCDCPVAQLTINIFTPTFDVAGCHERTGVVSTGGNGLHASGQANDIDWIDILPRLKRVGF